MTDLVVEYSRDDNNGEGGVRGTYKKNDNIVYLRYGSVGDRTVYIISEIEVIKVDESTIVYFKTMNYRFEDYDKEAQGSFRTYAQYKKRCDITKHILEDFVEEIFGDKAIIAMNIRFDKHCISDDRYVFY